MWALFLNLAFKVNRQVQAQKGAPAIQQKTSITRPDMWRVSLKVLFLLFGAGFTLARKWQPKRYKKDYRVHPRPRN